MAISRARDRLFILGSRAMLQELAKTMPFWKRVLGEFGDGIYSMPCSDVLSVVEQSSSLADVQLVGATDYPAIYCHLKALGSVELGTDKLKKIQASRKLLVLPEPHSGSVEGDYIVRQNAGCPPLFVGGGHVCIPFRGKWIVVPSPSVSCVLWRIGFSHWLMRKSTRFKANALPVQSQ